jgi:siroheme synthase
MLTVVGTGYGVAGQITSETLRSIVTADKLFYLVSDPITSAWLHSVNGTAESLDNSYRTGRSRHNSYEEMVERILAPVRLGLNVVAAFYGHPGVFCFPGHEAIRRARGLGIQAMMLPGISAQDCLIADLRLEPSHGMQSYEATDFLENRRRHDPSCMLLLWQIGAIGVGTFMKSPLWNRTGLARLTRRLLRSYSRNHEVVIYETPHLPTCDPRIETVPLACLPHADATVASLLYVPPK